MAGYTRQSASNIVDDGIINADDFNDEYNAIEAAFNASTGHVHDGTAANGARITEIGPTGDVAVSATQVLPLTTNTLDIGSAAAQFKNMYLDGALYVDTIGEDTLLDTASKVQFRDAAIYLNSSVDGQLDIVADTEVQIATTTLDINANADISGNLVVGGNVTIGSADISEAELEILDGATVTTAELNILDGATVTTAELNLLDGATVTTTEINLLDGATTATSTTLVDADRLIVNDAGTMKQVALSDFETYFEAGLDTLPNVTTVGALNAGSITSGFSSIDIGTSALTAGTSTLGNTSVGTLTTSGAGTVNSTLTVSGVTTLSSNLIVNGNTTLGNAATDTVTITADVASNIIPYADSTYTLGDSSNYWSNAYLDAVNTTGNVAVGGNLTVTGDLTVNGTTTTVNTTNTVVSDTLIELGNGTSSPVNDAGIVIERGSSANAFIGWDESVDKFTVGTGTFTGASTGNLTITTGTLVANLEGNVTGNLTGDVTGDVTGVVDATTLKINTTAVTATAAELNVLDGITATVTELNYVDGVTSNIQTQIDAISTELVNDTTPQLGGDLDANSNDILMGSQSVKFGTSKWEIVLDTGDNDLLFKYNGTTVFKLASTGAVTSADNITAYGTP